MNKPTLEDYYRYIGFDKRLSVPNMTGCMAVGISGDCGTECPVFMAGDCENEDEVLFGFSGKDQS